MNKQEREVFDRMRRYIERNGVVFDDGDRQEELAAYLSGDPIPVLIDLAREQGLKLLYTFSAAEQDESRKDRDGECWKNCTLDGRETWYSIGISTEALDRGRDYTVFVFLHELCHLFTGGGNHTAAFHSFLDYLLSEYNSANGAEIENDYQGLNRKRL